MTSFWADFLVDLIVDGVVTLIREWKNEYKPPEYTTGPSWKCPACDTLNPASKGVCKNCGESKPRSGKTMK